MQRMIAEALQASGLEPTEVDELLDTLANQHDNQTMAQIYRQVHVAKNANSLNSKAGVDNDLKNYAEAFDCLQSLGKLVKCETLVKGGFIAKQLLSAHEICVNASKNFAIGIVSAIGSIASMGNIFMGIIGLFFGGPDPTQLILEAIEKLSDQVNTVRTEMKNLFRQQANQTMLLFETVRKSLEDIKLNLRNAEIGIRTDMTNRFHQLQNQIDFGIDRLAENHRSMALRDLMQICFEVEKCAKDKGNNQSAASVLALASKLIITLKSTTLDPVLTGRNLWVTHQKNPKDIDSLLHQFAFQPNQLITQGLTDLNSYLAFFASYAADIHRRAILSQIDNANPKLHSPYSSNTAEMSNPAIINQALDSYLLLKCTQLLCSHNSDDHDLSDIEKMLNENAEFLAYIQTDRALYETLLSEYFENLREINDIIIQYGEFESQQYSELLNKTYIQHEMDKKLKHGITPQEKVDINILNDDHNKFLCKFKKRAINNIHGDISSTAMMKSALIPFEKSRLYATVTASKHKAITLLAAGEFLQLWSIQAEQTSLRIGKKMYNYIIDGGVHGPLLFCCYNITDLKFPKTERNGTDETKIVWTRSSSHLTIGEESRDLIEESHFIAAISGLLRPAIGAGILVPTDVLPTTEWTIDFDIKINQNHALKLQFKNKWQHTAAIFKESWAYPNTYIVYEKDASLTIHAEIYRNGDEKKYKDFRHNLLKHILSTFNSDTNTISAKMTGNHDTVEYCKNIIMAHLFGKRKEIANNLCHSKAPGNGQAIVEKFHEALQKLDKTIMSIKMFGWLAGKSPEHAVFKKLLDSHTILEELGKYAKLTKPDFKQALCPSLDRALAQKETNKPIIVDLLIKLKRIANGDLSPSHPLLMIEGAQQKIKMYNLWQRIQTKNNLSKKGDTEIKHNIKLKRSELKYLDYYINQTAYQLYKEARFTIAHHFLYSEKLLPETYSRLFNECLRFICKEAANPLYTGAIIQHHFNLNERESQKWLISTFSPKTQIPYAISHIGLLCNLLSQYMGVDRKNIEPHRINLALWLDGIVNFLDLIFNDRYETVAIEAGYTLEGKISALTQCLKPAYRLLQTTYRLGTNYSLFQQLFVEYEGLLENLINFVSQYNNQAQYNDPQYETLLMTISAQSILLQMLIELTFGKEIVTHSGYQFIGEMQNIRTSPSLKEIPQCWHSIKIYVLNKTKIAEQLLSFHHYLKESSQNEPASGNAIILNNDHLDCLKLREGQALLFKFLNKNSNINAIRLEKMNILPATIQVIHNTLKIHPQLQSLELSDGQPLSIDILLDLEKAVSASKVLQHSCADFGAGLTQFPSANLTFGPSSLTSTIELTLKAREVLLRRQSANTTDPGSQSKQSAKKFSLSFFKIAKTKNVTLEENLAANAGYSLL